MLATIQRIGVSPVLPSVSDYNIRANGAPAPAAPAPAAPAPVAPAPVARAVPGLVNDVCSVCQDTITMRQSSTLHHATIGFITTALHVG